MEQRTKEEGGGAEQAKEWQEWIASRPECVQRLIQEFPPMTRVIVDGRMLFVFAYTESDEILVSPINPSVDYEGAVASKEVICAKHLRAEYERKKV